MECRAPRDVGPPPHQHDWEEAYYVLEGEVRFSLDGQVRVVKAGGFVHIPQGVVHGFSGASERPARMLILDIPAHTEGFFRDVEREVRELPRDLSKVPEIGDRHGIRFLRP
jgi:quercetin dioxygenase-like cupin family protein